MTVVRTEFPDPLMGQLSVKVPGAVGVNVTDSVTDCPAWIVWPSGRAVVAANSPSPGGFDFVMVRGVPPAFVTTKDAVADWPTETSPKLRATGLTCRSAGAPPVPERLTVADPPVSLAKVNASMNDPDAVGENEIETLTDPPGESDVPFDGIPATVKGACGRVSPVIVRL